MPAKSIAVAKKLTTALFAALILSSPLSGLAADDGAGAVPRQFLVWGKKGPGYDYFAALKAPAEFKEISPETNTADPALEGQMAKDAEAMGYLLFPKHHLEQVFPSTAPFLPELGRPMRQFSTPGQYVPMTFCVRALRDLRGVCVSADPMRSGNGGVIPANHIDVRTMKCILSPLWKKGHYRIEPRYMESFDEFDILDLQAKTTRQFWLTVKIPDAAPAGVYKGKIHVKPARGVASTMDMEIKVLPFKLERPDPKEMLFSILTNDNDERITSGGQGLYPQNIRKDFADMVEHGLTSTGYLHMGPWFGMDDGKVAVRFDKQGSCCQYTTEQVMDFYKEAGLTGPVEYQKGPKEQALFSIEYFLKLKPFTPEYDAAFEKITRATVDKVRQEAWPEFIFFIGDEPGVHSDRLKRDMRYGGLVKKAAPEARTANYFNGGEGDNADWLLLKPVTDINCTNYTSPGLLKRSKESGYKDIWLYNGGTATQFPPIDDRMFYGFTAWKLGAKGVTQFIYQASGEQFNAFSMTEPPILYTYPTPTGPLPTPWWEAIRDGVCDYLYLYTLSSAITKAEQDADPAVKALASVAKADVEKIMGRFSVSALGSDREKLREEIGVWDLDVYRWRLADWTVRLRGAMNKLEVK